MIATGTMIFLTKVNRFLNRSDSVYTFRIHMTRRAPQVAQPREPDPPDLPTLRSQIRQDADELFGLITIEVAAGNQMEATEKRLQELKKICREENAQIRAFNSRIPAEKERAAKLREEDGAQQSAPPDPDEAARTRIAELEKELKQFYLVSFRRAPRKHFWYHLTFLASICQMSLSRRDICLFFCQISAGNPSIFLSQL
jgi:hypothetical protein